jgi:DNA-binding LytR/AlgR family response regulator
MKVVIVEDELMSSRRLERMLTGLQCEVVTSLVSVKLAVMWLKTHAQPDILFLDIQLSDGLCFEIFEQIKVESAIIFTTAFSDYSLKAFDYKSISYLLKPIKIEQLQDAITKTNSHIKNKNEIQSLRELIENRDRMNYKKAFTVKVGNRIKIVEVKDISCLYSSDNATFLHSQGNNYIINYSLLSLMDDLNPENFFQVSRKCIINKSAINSCNRYKNNRLQIVIDAFNEFEIVVSRERVKEFKNWIS